MKPVVSSIVALALALAPMTALAKPHKTPHAKVVKSHKADKTSDADIAASDKDSDKSSKSPIVRVKAGKKMGAHVKRTLHHAHNVDLGGAGHKEPKADDNGAIVQASMKTSAHGKPAHGKPSPKASEMPKLPNPNAGKPTKGGAEKGTRKAAEKKNEGADANDGEPMRDEEFAELVAHIRGQKVQSGDPEPAAKDEARDHLKSVNDEARDLKTREPASGSEFRGSSRGEAPRNLKSESDKVAKSASSRRASPEGGADKKKAEPPCSRDPIEIVRGPEVERFELTKCNGQIAALAVERLSILIRPGSAARPTTPVAELAKKPGQELAHGIRRVDPRLVDRIQNLADHFGKPGAPAKLFVISGYRPMSVGSMHSTGRAIDFRVEGVKNEDVVAFCKTLADTGCGYYPNSSFVHLDVRDEHAGHVSWIDASGPGETPRYVSTWPPVSRKPLEKTSATRVDGLAEEGANLLRARRPVDRESAPEAVDEHPGDLPQ